MTTKNGWKKKLLWTFLGILLIFGLVRLYYNVTDDFRLSNITYEMPYHREWDRGPLSEQERIQIQSLIAQPFTYVGKGAQSYVFASEDGKYVIKFFKFKHLKPSLLTLMLPGVPPFQQYRDSIIGRKQKKLNSVFNGYHLAYAVHKEESGINFMQLNPNEGNFPYTVILKDKIGLTREINLNQVVFVIQEKGKTLRNTLRELFEKDDVSLAKQRIGQIFDLYLSEYNKGIYDHDHGVMHNTGFVGEKPIHLDVGKLYKDDSIRQKALYQQDLDKIYAKIDLWVKEEYPEYYPEVSDYMQEKYHMIFGVFYQPNQENLRKF